MSDPNVKLNVKLKSRARARIHNRVTRGQLEPPVVCAVCGVDVSLYNHLRVPGMPQLRIEAHHYNGHDHPLDVWWVCHQCNMRLRREHDGSLTPERAREKYRIPYIADTHAYARERSAFWRGDVLALSDAVRAVMGE